MRPGGLVLLTIDSDLGRMAAFRLAQAFPELQIIVEEHVSRAQLLLRRLRRKRPLQVGGQLAFLVFARVQRRLARARIAEIMRAADLHPAWPEGRSILRVASVNAPECIAHLRRLAPRAVLVVGTRIIDRAVLGALSVPFLNYHAGITPKYRGIHGGYWAKAEGDLANFGVTVHLVDPGIDTGGVLHQARLKPGPRDNYSTYPYLQLAAALPLLERAAREAMAGELAPVPVSLPSRLWSHPTLWGYLRAGFKQGAW